MNQQAIQTFEHYPYAFKRIHRQAGVKEIDIEKDSQAASKLNKGKLKRYKAIQAILASQPLIGAIEQ